MNAALYSLVKPGATEANHAPLMLWALLFPFLADLQALGKSLAWTWQGALRQVGRG